jgi:serine/threonine protein kinase
MREAQTMILIDHPNVVKAHCSFAKDQTLWVVMPYMAGGSCLHILKSVSPYGFEEAIIATVLREALKGLEYLHHHGHIHRDVKVDDALFQPTLVLYICSSGYLYTHPLLVPRLVHQNIEISRVTILLFFFLIGIIGRKYSCRFSGWN